jgi:hypothetical protein
VCKHIQCPLLHLARVCYLAASAVTPRSYEDKWSPLHTLTFSRTIGHRLLVVLLVLGERERKESENERES